MVYVLFFLIVFDFLWILVVVIFFLIVFLLELFFLDFLNSVMEVLCCFNCDYMGRRQEDFFNIINIYFLFIGKLKIDVEIGLNELFKESIFFVCCDCVYDCFQECYSCLKKVFLCMFKLVEWFNDKKNWNCIDCVVMFEVQEFFQIGYYFSVIICQCLVC